MSSIEQIEKERLGGARLAQQKWSPSLASVRRSELRGSTVREGEEREKGTPAERNMHCHLEVSIHAPTEAISSDAEAGGSLRPSIHAHSPPDNFH